MKYKVSTDLIGQFSNQTQEFFDNFGELIKSKGAKKLYQEIFTENNTFIKELEKGRDIILGIQCEYFISYHVSN